MGCCENREKSEKTTTAFKTQPLYSSLYQDALILGIVTSDKIKDQRATEILSHILELEELNKWVDVLKEKDITAKKVDCSKFSENFIVTRLSMNFNISVPLIIILKTILEANERLKWDSTLKSFEILNEDIWTNIVYMKLKVMFYSVDFVDKHIVTLYKDSVYIISYSVYNDNFPQNKESTRGYNIMGAIRISEKEGATNLTIINQCDPKSKASILASSLGIFTQKQWIQKFQKQVFKLLGI